MFARCSVRGHPETPDPGSLSRLSSPPVSAPDPVRIHPGEGVAGSEVTGPGQWTGTPRPRAARGPPPTRLGTLSWDSGPRGVKARLLAPPSPCLTSNRRPAWERGAGTEWPRRVSAWPWASGPGGGGGVAAAWPLFTVCWIRASDRAANGFPLSGPREGAPSRLRPLPSVGGRAEPRWGPGAARSVCLGFVAGVSLALCSASAVPSPKGLF